MSVRMKLYLNSGSITPALVCGNCVNEARDKFGDRIDFDNPIRNDGAYGKIRPCDICGKMRKLVSKGGDR